MEDRVGAVSRELANTKVLHAFREHRGELGVLAAYVHVVLFYSLRSLRPLQLRGIRVTPHHLGLLAQHLGTGLDWHNANLPI